MLEKVPFEQNSDNFGFDSPFLVPCAHFGFKLGDDPVPVRYFDGASSISLWASTVYVTQTLGVFGRWMMHRVGLHSPMFQKS